MLRSSPERFIFYYLIEMKGAAEPKTYGTYLGYKNQNVNQRPSNI